MRFAALFAAAAATALTPAIAAAQFPSKPINVIIDFNLGGESDVTARFIEPYFKRLTPHGITIQYKAGAGGAAAWSQLNTMPADGHPVMGTNLPHIVLQPLQKDVGYQTAELKNVYWFHFTPGALLISASSPIKTLKDFIEAAKKAPGSITLGGSGTNSANHIAQQRFDKLAGIKTTYVPFGGTGPNGT